MEYHGNVILAAHRGDKKNCPENTMPAFERALALGVDMIETDIHMTCDGQLVLMHDRSTLRTTGVDGFIDRMSFEQIKKLDAGAVFGEAFRNTQVPSVRDFMEWLRSNDLLINWELKDYPSEVGDDFAFRAADTLIEMIEAYDLGERSMINSFSDRVLEHVFLQHGHRYPLHGQGILKGSKAKDTAATSQEELYDWCCLYPDAAESKPLDFPRNFAYCAEHSILACVCVPDVLEEYAEYVKLGCRMFTSNDIEQADRILRALNLRA